MRADAIHGHAFDAAGAGIALAELFGAAHPVIVFLVVFPDEIGLQLVDGFPTDGDTARPQIAAVDALICKRIEGIALTLGPFTGKADIEAVVDDGNVQHAFEAALAIVSEFGARHRFELIGWLGGGDVHHACGRIAAVERALGPAQNFQLPDIEEFLFEEMIADKRCVVQRDGHRRIGGY